MTTPGCLKYDVSSLVSLEYSLAPQEFEITVAPSATASFSAAPRFASEFELASTSRILQFWQMACRLDVERDLERPARARCRVRRAAGLVDLAEAAVGGRARRQAVLAREGAEVALDVRVVVRVDDPDRLRVRRVRRQVVAGVEAGGGDGAGRRGRRRERPPARVGDDGCVAARDVRDRKRADARDPRAPSVIEPRRAD